MADLQASIGLNRSDFEAGLGALKSQVSKFSSEIGGILAGGFAAGSIFEGLKGAIEKGGMLGDLAEKFGIAGSSLQKLGNSASLSGSSVEDVAAAMNKAAIKAQEAVGGNEALQASFAKIGLTVADLASASPEQIMMAFADAMASGSIKGQEFALAVDLMGKSATNLLPMLSQGSAAINAQGESMGVWSDETIANLKAADDQIKELKNTFTMFFGGIAALANPFFNFTKKLFEVMAVGGVAIKQALSGDKAAAMELVKEINRIIDEDRSARPLGAGGPKTVGEQASDESTKAAEAAAKKTKDEQEKMMDLYRQADAVRRRQMLNAMSDEDKLQALMQERADLMNKINKTPEGVDRAKLALEQANLDAQIGPLQTKVQNDVMKNMIGSEATAKVASSRTEPMQILADSLQRVGGGGNFARVGGAEAVQKDQLTALKSIDKGITKLANQTSITGADTGVQ